MKRKLEVVAPVPDSESGAARARRASSARSESAAEQLFWADLRRSTQSRIGLGRTGDALPTARVLEFRAAHSAARDAVHMPLDVPDLAGRVAALGVGSPVHVRSSARDRAEYLRRPDFGRLPEPRDVARGSGSGRPHAVHEGGGGVAGEFGGVAEGGGSVSGEFGGAQPLSVIPHSGADIGFVLADGLSPRALTNHGVETLAALIEELAPHYSIAAPVIATQARVALGDHIAAAMGVTTVLVLIGERPGLSVADSLGIYLTHLPRPGRTDADRNCVSNIHPPEGLGYRQAAKVVSGLISGARTLGRSGVDLKDTSRAETLPAAEVISITPERS